MKIFGPQSLQSFDRATGRVSDRSKRVHMEGMKNPFVKRAGLFGRWVLKPALVVALATLGLHEYNKSVEREWINPTFNLYEQKQRILWQTRYLILQMARSIYFGSKNDPGASNLSHVDPVKFYVDRVQVLAGRSLIPMNSSEKILYESKKTKMSMPMFEWQTTNHRRMIQSNGDLVEVDVTYPIKLFGLKLFDRERVKVLKKYRPLTNKKTIFGIELYDLGDVDLQPDIAELETYARLLGLPPTTEDVKKRAKSLESGFKIIRDFFTELEK